MPGTYQKVGHRTFLENAVDLRLARQLGPDDTATFVHSVDDLVDGRVPFYAVIDPFNDVNREYVEVASFDRSTKQIQFARRNMAGTDGRTHRAGVIVRVTFMSQHLDDLWDAVITDKTVPGPTGPAGTPGTPGTPGAPGPAGSDSTVQGPPGARGDKLFLGVGAPTLMSTSGSQPGDEYIDMTTGDLYTLT